VHDIVRSTPASQDVNLVCRGNFGQYFSSWIYRCSCTAYNTYERFDHLQLFSTETIHVAVVLSGLCLVGRE